jgi:peptidoglycan/xylan/chitin deacetylase (PgdA/CDA1 family)
LNERTSTHRFARQSKYERGSPEEATARLSGWHRRVGGGQRIMKVGAGAKEIIKKALVNSHALQLAGQWGSSGAVILMYHSVQDQPWQFANSIGTGIIHATSVFERQMKLIAGRFRPVTLEEVLLFLNGKMKLPPRAVAVTFDDGFADNYDIAAPILTRYGIRAVFYVTAALIGTNSAPWYCRLRFAFATTRRDAWRDLETGRMHPRDSPDGREKALLAAFDSCASLAGNRQEETVARIESNLESELRPSHDGSRFMMDWDQVRRLNQEGHSVGSHTLTHPNVAHVISEEILRRELSESKRKIEQAIGSTVDHFSYPHPALIPQWNEETVAMTRRVGYLSAVTTTPGPVRATADPLRLTRIGAPRADHQFLWNLEWTFLGRRV